MHSASHGRPYSAVATRITIACTDTAAWRCVHSAPIGLPACVHGVIGSKSPKSDVSLKATGMIAHVTRYSCHSTVRSARNFSLISRIAETSECIPRSMSASVDPAANPLTIRALRSAWSRRTGKTRMPALWRLRHRRVRSAPAVCFSSRGMHHVYHGIKINGVAAVGEQRRLHSLWTLRDQRDVLRLGRSCVR
jgi:hypothetical protein